VGRERGHGIVRDAGGWVGVCGGWGHGGGRIGGERTGGG
jgi:hypothetical protein